MLGPFGISTTQAARRRAVPALLALPRQPSDATTQILFPIAGLHHHTGARGGFLGPIYGWASSNGAGGWGAGIAPIAALRPQRHAQPRHGAAAVRPRPRLAHRHRDDRRRPRLLAHDARRRRRRPLPDSLRRPPQARLSYAVIPGLFCPQERRAQLHRGHRPGLRRARNQRLCRRPGAALLRRPRRPALAPGRFPLVWHFADSARAPTASSSAPTSIAATATRVADVFFPLLLRAPLADEGFGIWPIGAWRRVDGVDHRHRPVRAPVERAHRLAHQHVLPARHHPRVARASACAFCSPSSGASTTATRSTPPSSRSISAAARPTTASTACSRCSCTRYNKTAPHARRPHLVSLAHRRRQAAGLFPLLG